MSTDQTSTFQPFTPPPHVRGLLRQTFYARGEAGYLQDKILPNGLAAAVFMTGAPYRVGKSVQPADNPSFEHSFLHGVQTTPVHNAAGGESQVLGIVFEPPGMHGLFGTDMEQLCERTVDARDVLPEDVIAGIEALLPRAAEKGTHEELVRLLIKDRVPRMPAWLPALYADIVATQGRLSLIEAYIRFGLSPDHVSEGFRRAVGVSPEDLSRICRLQALVKHIDPAAPVAWKQLIDRFDFPDLQSFARDFHAFSGEMPDEYLDRLMGA